MTLEPKITPSHPSAQGPSYLILRESTYRIEPSALRSLAHTLGLNSLSCPKYPHTFEEHLIEKLTPLRGERSIFSGVLEYVSDSSRIAQRELLTRDYHDGVQRRLTDSPDPSAKRERHEIISDSASSFAHGTTSKELMALIQSSDLARVLLPVIDHLIDNTEGFLVRRIPPHVGHGVRRTLAFEAREVIEREMEEEAQQDRGSARGLLQKLKAFITTGSLESFQTFMRSYNNSGEWLDWMRRTPDAEATYPEAEQVLANTFVMLYQLKQLTAEYVGAFMVAGPPAYLERFPWYNAESEVKGLTPLSYPLFATALEMVTRSDFRK